MKRVCERGRTPRRGRHDTEMGNLPPQGRAGESTGSLRSCLKVLSPELDFVRVRLRVILPRGNPLVVYVSSVQDTDVLYSPRGPCHRMRNPSIPSGEASNLGGGRPAWLWRLHCPRTTLCPIYVSYTTVEITFKLYSFFGPNLFIL